MTQPPVSPVSDPTPRRYQLGMAARTAMLAWLVTIATVFLFVTAVIPMQKRSYAENLESGAHGLAVSLRDVAAGALVTEDFGTVVDHAREVLNGHRALDFIVIAKNDGLAFIIDRQGWREDPQIPRSWRPSRREATGQIELVPMLGRRVFHYAMPFDTSGIAWGWIHLGLSLSSYDQSIQAVYMRTGVLAAFCIAISLVVSLVYARRAVQPILVLRSVVAKVTEGDLTARASIRASEEIEGLADSFNAMTDALRARDAVLESVRFAAQQFLSSPDWRLIIDQVLAKIGQAAHVHRVSVVQNQPDSEGRLRMYQRHEWVAAGVTPQLNNPVFQGLPWYGHGLDHYAEHLKHGGIVVSRDSEWGPVETALLAAYGIRSLVLTPVFLDREWWGFICFDECRRDRGWATAELDSLQAAADMLSTAISRQRTQEALVQAKEAAEAASQAKSQFLANMSHEIRTPITGVMGMLQLLQRTNLDKRQTRYASNALTAAETLLTVIGDVLDFSKIEAGKMELEPHSFDPVEVVETVVRLFAERAEDKGIELACRATEDVPRLAVGDSNRLRQVLVNLLANAVKFTVHGEVVVTCRRQPTPGTEAIHLRFEVRDTGCGIAPDQQRLIFDPFSQADNSMSRKHGGTGLGLAICRQLCELMGGSIGVESTPGKGSTFWFEVRLQPVAAAPASHLASVRDLGQLRVLVVDDCDVVRSIYREMIGAWNGHVAAAPDGSAALAKLREAAQTRRPFHVAILDWKMPGMDGLTLARTIKRDAELQDTRLVLLTGFAREGTTDEIFAAGFLHSISKPASQSDLYDAIATAAHQDQSPAPGSTVKPAAAAWTDGQQTCGTVLLAEDNEINREFAAEILADLGYQCRWARTGAEALTLWREGGVDLVLMDCQMPEMDGYQATRLIREEEAARGTQRLIPIVALTAHAAKSDRARCLQAGMNDYLTKPLDGSALAKALARWIPRDLNPSDAPTGAHLSPVQDPGEVFDHSDLLNRCKGNRELADRLIHKLADQAAHDLADIERGLERKDLPAVAAAAHRLKGASANVSAGALRRVAADIETAGGSHDLPMVVESLSALRREIERLESARQSLVALAHSP